MFTVLYIVLQDFGYLNFPKGISKVSIYLSMTLFMTQTDILLTNPY